MLIFCRWILRIVAVLYAAAIALLLIGTFGLFGQEKDPLAAVFLMPLGLPWSLWLDQVPGAFALWLAILAPALNLFIAAALCRIVARRRSGL